MFVQTVKMEHFDRAGKENRFRLIKRKDIKEIQRSSSEQARVFCVLKLWQLGRTLKGHSSNFICQSVFFFFFTKARLYLFKSEKITKITPARAWRPKFFRRKPRVMD